MSRSAIDKATLKSPFDPAVLAEEEKLRLSIQSDPAPKNLHVGILNPWALTQLLVGENVQLKNDDASRKIVGDTLGMPYEKLLDPKSNSPLFPHLKYEDGKLIDLLTEGKSIDRASRWGKNADKIEALFASKSPNAGSSQPYEPGNFTWQDRGNYSPDSIDFDDVVQGIGGDCWLMAALISVAWVWPWTIMYTEITETGQADPDHNTSLKLYSKGGSHDAGTAIVQVSDQVLANSWGYIAYAKSRNSTEIWPGVWEKAFAKWSTGNTTDRPDITALNGGDPIRACAQILNRSPVYHSIGNPKKWKDNWKLLIEKYCSNNVAKVPLTAWTFTDASRDYNGTGLVANHAYAILGCLTDQEGFRYVVLRNPWGSTESVNGDIRCMSGWINLGGRDINLDVWDGTYAIEISPFCYYFTTWGAALK